MMKKMKKITAGMLQTLAMVLIVAAFVYLFYYFYGEYRDYRSLKGRQASPVAPSEMLSPPSFHTFEITPMNRFQYRLFTFKEQKRRGDDMAADGMGDMAGAESTAVSSDFTVLGVVKKDRLYLVVRLHAGNKIKLFARGQTINKGNKVKKLTLSRAVVSGPGGEQVHKIFKTYDIKEIKHD